MYLDARAGATGRDQFEPFLRKAFRDRLRTYPPHSPGHASFSADIERIKRFLANELQPSPTGVAVFACAGADGFFETLQLDVAFDEHRLYLDDVPHLYPLARVDDQHPRYAAVVADTNFARIFVFGTGRIVREAAIAGVKTKHVRAGGWSQAAAEEVPAPEKVANQLVTLARQTSPGRERGPVGRDAASEDGAPRLSNDEGYTA